MSNGIEFRPVAATGGSRLPAGLISAYLNAEYRIEEAGRPHLPLRPGHPCHRLDALLLRHRVRSAAFITACNPHSRPLPSLVNRRLLQALQQWLRRRHWRYIPGYGCGPDWPAEPSLLLLGCSRVEGDRLARQFRQHGWIALQLRRPPMLRLLR